jgi:hypothetical protein
MVAAMDKVGVAGAILISPFSMYRYERLPEARYFSWLAAPVRNPRRTSV